MNIFELRQSIEKETQVTFARSSGSGGQNVNKVNTRVHASVALDSLKGLSELELCQVKKRFAPKGILQVSVQDERSQELNRSIALKRLESKIIVASHIQKKRKQTKPTKASRERRLKLKKIRSQIKKTRKFLASEL